MRDRTRLLLMAVAVTAAVAVVVGGVTFAVLYRAAHADARPGLAEAALLTIGLSALILGTGVALFLRASAPLVRRLEGERRLRAVMDTAVDAIVTIDERGRIESVNDSVQRMFGWPPAELVGRNVSVLMPSPYREEHDGYLARYLATGQAKIIGIGREATGQRRDGATFPIHLAVSELREGPRVRFIGMIRDISDLKKTEERMRALVQTAGTVILFLSPEHRILEWNREAERVFGWSREEALGRDYFDLCLPRALWEPIDAEIRANLAGRPTTGYENEVRHRDGTHRSVLWNSTRMLDEQGRPVGIIATGTDLTERKELERQLMQAQRVETIGQLAGGIAHDFNNIITGIAMSSDVLIGRLAPDDPARELGDEIRRAAGRARDLTRQLLVFSRAQVVEPKLINLNDLVRDQVETLLKRLIGEDVDVVLEMAPDLGTVRVDPGQAQQLLMNLALNARDAMPDGGMLRVATRNQEVGPELARRTVGARQGPHVVLEVRDDGVGIDAATMPRIFDPFFTTKGPDKGTGLGLSTVYAVVRKAGGFIQVESAPGRGATFRVFLPRVEGAGEPPVGGASAAPAAGPLRILLVEDDDSIRRPIRQVLTERGHAVADTGDPRQAEAMAEGIDLLITDVVMPEINGVELAARVRRRAPKAAVLYMSGYTQDKAGGGGPPETGATFLQKPFNTDDLLRKIDEALADGPR